jgi:hypothetical protein
MEMSAYLSLIRLKSKLNTKRKSMRPKGIEPMSQDWGSGMLPLHQRRPGDIGH